MHVLILNGPNLNLLGQREPDIYGHETLSDIENTLRRHAQGVDVDIDFLQTNFEGEMLERIHRARQDADAIIINPAAWSHTSVALLDALKAFEGRVVEVHLSNIHTREAFRHHSYVSARADAVIAGMGSFGYFCALDFLTR